ncbi:MAG: D-alanyl-D-alanine carboxypeptidase family protein [Gammaproteobacteria bacterium]|jgi:D-alanyl-D-alanine carboxypeptidase (penicillin-binding protein 5/6)
MTIHHRCGLAALLALLTLPSSAVTPATSAASTLPATPALPGPVAARQFILVDQATGQTLAAQGEDQRAEPASITKLMTAYVVFKALAEKRLRLEEPVTISERAWRAEGSRTFVEVGKQVPVEVLIKGMIVQSGNDAAIALAERVAGSEPAFAELMNAEAQRLGMRGSRFANATGLPDPGLYSTARDIATLSRAIIRDYPQFYSWYSLREYEFDGIRQPNRNGLLARDAGVDGLKTGHTASAGYCLASSAMRAGTRFVSVVLGAESPRKREEASMLLLEHGFRNFETVRLRKAGDTVLRPRVFKGAAEQIEIVPATDVATTVQRGRAGALRTATTVSAPLVAPFKAGQRVGEIQVLDGARVVQRVPLVAKSAVPEGGLWARLRDTVLLWFQ